MTALSGLRVREAPTLNSSVTGLVPFALEVEVLSRTDFEDKIDGRRAFWYRVAYWRADDLVRRDPGQSFVFGGMAKAQGWVFGGYLAPMKDFPRIQLPYLIRVSSTTATNCCYQRCSRPPRCADSSFAEANWEACDCGEGCEGGGLIVAADYGWTPTLQEWLTEPLLQMQIVYANGPLQFRPKACPCSE